MVYCIIMFKKIKYYTKGRVQSFSI